MHKDEISHDAVLEDAKTSKKQLQCNNALKLYLANVLASCLDSAVESENILLKAIETKGIHGRTKGLYDTWQNPTILSIKTSKLPLKQ